MSRRQPDRWGTRTVGPGTFAIASLFRSTSRQKWGTALCDQPIGVSFNTLDPQAACPAVLGRTPATAPSSRIATLGASAPGSNPGKSPANT